MATLDPDLKRAVVRLPDREKDKLLLRLIAKDGILTERLQFELIERGSTVADRRDAIRAFADRTARAKHDSAKALLKAMRNVVGYVTRHVKVTKDKYGDVELTLYLLNAFFDHHKDALRHHNSRTDRLAYYVAKRTEQTLKKLEKLDPDYYLEFEAEVAKLLERVHHYCPHHHARQLGLPTEWPRT